MKQKLIMPLLLLIFVSCKNSRVILVDAAPLTDTINRVNLYAFSFNHNQEDTTNNCLASIDFIKYFDNHKWMIGTPVGDYTADTTLANEAIVDGRIGRKGLTIQYVGAADLIDTSRMISTTSGYGFGVNPQLKGKPIFKVYSNNTVVKTWVMASNDSTNVEVGSCPGNIDTALAKKVGTAYNYYLYKLNSFPVKYSGHPGMTTGN
jgi:hypothetical protein